jgi:NAD(P)-dependent dehydrogenase (short-subunit alcohol dehydrogenase family)
MSHTVLVTGASSGFGAMTVRALADAGHTVHAGMRDIEGHNRAAAADAAAYADQHGVALRAVELDVSDQQSVDGALERIAAEHGTLDTVVHNAGHMVLGPTESFTTEEMAEIYDTNVLSTQRVNRGVLPAMRDRGDGLIVWIGSSSTYGGTPPYLGPYFAAKAAEDHIAKAYAAELAPFGVDTCLVIPGSFTSGTEHFAHAMTPADTERVHAYDERLPHLMDQVSGRLAELAPPDQDPGEVARAVVDIVGMPKGKRPFRVTIDPADDGSETVSTVADRVRAQFYHRIGLERLLTTATS